VPALAAALADEGEHGMVRHEAAEALGAVGTPAALARVRAHAGDACREVAETCQLALARAAWAEREGGGDDGASASRFLSVDPAPPFPAATPLPSLRSTLLDETAPIFDRYRALFALRNEGGADAVDALCVALRSSSSALLKHEVAYVLGQLQAPASLAALRACLADAGEHGMVRHEAAEALGAVGADAATPALAAAAADPDPVVAQSAVVALDVLKHEASGAFEYAGVAGGGEGGAVAVA
jgi:deoxyhypusine monooxygenase